MRTTVNLDDDLLKQAHELTGITERPALLREALQALVTRESARRLALLGGSDPNAVAPPRRRPAMVYRGDEDHDEPGKDTVEAPTKS